MNPLQTPIYHILEHKGELEALAKFQKENFDKNLAVPPRADLDSILPMEKDLERIMREKPNPRRVD